MIDKIGPEPKVLRFQGCSSLIFQKWTTWPHEIGPKWIKVIPYNLANSCL